MNLFNCISIIFFKMEPWFGRFWLTRIRCKQSEMNQLPTFVMENSTKKDFRKMAFSMAAQQIQISFIFPSK